jgi:tetratricopeptide (TPR) repeat protein
LGNLGIAYAALGDSRRAIEHYEQARAIAREIGDRRGEAIGSWNLGDEYAKLGELEKAIALMQVTVDFEREIGHPNAETRAASVEALRARLASGT